MEQTPTPGRRLNILTRAERRRRIFGRLREGWAYDEIAREERVSAERVGLRGLRWDYGDTLLNGDYGDTLLNPLSRTRCAFRVCGYGPRRFLNGDLVKCHRNPIGDRQGVRRRGCVEARSAGPVSGLSGAEINTYETRHSGAYTTPVTRG
jgi:hypothetical protein